MSGVELAGVSKTFGREGHAGLAVNEVTLTVAAGEFLVLVGPSGCGKSTLLRMVAGLEEVTSGEIRIAGRRVNDVAPRDRDVAMVFQNYALYPHMSVFENLAFGLKLRKVPRDEVRRRVETAAGTLGLERYLDRRPRELSGGERQRVALGRAMVREPKVFLFDEPLSNLDARLRVEMRAEIRRLHRRVGATMIYVTHDQVEAMTMGDRIAVLRDGLLQQVAAPREIYEQPANMYVAGFIGSPKMNFIPVTVQGQTAKAAGFDVQLPRAPGIEKGVLGLRPEDLSEETRDGTTVVEMFVEVVEVLGSDQYLYGKVGGDDVVARVDPHFKAFVGDRVNLGINMRRLHLFDSETEKAVL